MEPQTTKVPAEKKLMNKDRPLMDQGTAPPAAKKDFISPPCLPNDKPAPRIINVKIKMVR